VVGEAGLGKTTLLKSFFKSFRDEDATSALFMRKETQNVGRSYCHGDGVLGTSVPSSN